MKKKKKKKVLKFFGIIFLVVLGLLVAMPFFLEGKIADILKNKVNQNVNATLDFEDANLSLIKSFPNAYVNLINTSLVNKAPFKGDTLFYSGTMSLQMSIKELFKSANEPITIKSLILDNAKLHIKIDADENANYNIGKETEGETETTSEEKKSNNFTLALEAYEIKNTEIIYDDFSSGMHLVISEINHSGTGDLALEKSELQTKTDALVSFELDSTKYLSKNKISLDALIGIDLKENSYSFLENKALINQLPLVFDGFVKVNEENQEVDISFKTPSSDFKNFLALIPEAYSKNIENVKTTGNFQVDGKFKGIVDEEHIPTFAININSKNASFKYPDLPKAVKNVFINTQINNETGITEDTYVNINKLSFQINQNQFNVNAKIRELLGNTKVNAHADGKINLANISKVYPVPTDLDLSGLLNADVTTTFDIASIEQKKYENTNTNGKMHLTGFKYSSDELKKPIEIATATLTFNPSTVSLDSFDGKIGKTNFKANGIINNLLGFLFNEENVEGNFKLQSNTFALNDFMVDEAIEDETNSETPTTVERIKIPSFLDCTIDATANNVFYDNLNLKNVTGLLKIKDETAILQNFSSDLFDGKLNINGSVSTKSEISTFDMTLGIKSFKIEESFKALDIFKVLAPAANALRGKLNSTIKLSGNLKDDMTPSLGVLTGNVLVEILSTDLDTKNAPLLKALDTKLGFIDLEKINLKGLKTALLFDNGTVKVKPFSLKYKDIAINIDGSHTFDSQLEYKATLDVPAKYLGEEVTKLLARIDDSSLKNLTIPITANIKGNYTSPNVTTDLTSGVSKLTKQLVEIEKEKLVNKGKDKAKDLLGGLLDGDKKDSTKIDATEASTADVLGRLLGKKEDSTKIDSTAKKDATDSILGGILSKKKKKDTAKQNAGFNTKNTSNHTLNLRV